MASCITVEIPSCVNRSPWWQFLSQVNPLVSENHQSLWYPQHATSVPCGLLSFIAHTCAPWFEPIERMSEPTERRNPSSKSSLLSPPTSQSHLLYALVLRATSARTRLAWGARQEEALSGRRGNVCCLCGGDSELTGGWCCGAKGLGKTMSNCKADYLGHLLEAD